MRSAASLALLVGVTLGFTNTMAETFYKLVDKNGKVAYSESVPPNFDGQVLRLQIDSNTNTALSPPAGRADGVAPSETENEKIIRRRPPDNDDQIQAARLKVEAAQGALDRARDNSTPEDWVYVGRGNPQGVRRFPRPEYEARLAQLETDVKVAEEDLKKLQRHLF